MKLKITNKHTNYKINTLLITTILLTSLLHISLSIVFLLIFVEFIIMYYINKDKYEIVNNNLTKLKRFAKIITCCIVIFFLIQCLILQLYFDMALDDFITLTILFIGIPIVIMASKALRNFEAYIMGLNLFIIMFSLYYLVLVSIKGLPDDRDSILGYVSSNYIAAILYISYPVIFYYLFGRNTLNRNAYKSNRIKCYLALGLSLIVIIISGSRSAFGAIALEIIALLFLKKKSLKDTIKLFIFLITIIGLIYIAYISISDVSQLITRGMNALNGNNELKNDIRSVVWDQAMIDFNKMNKFFGSGSVIVQTYVRPPHNVFLEVLLLSGYVGVGVYILYIIFSLKLILKNRNGYQKYFIMLTLAISFLIGYVQPFFSTAYTCGIIMWTAIIAIASDDIKILKKEGEK